MEYNDWSVASLGAATWACTGRVETARQMSVAIVSRINVALFTDRRLHMDTTTGLVIFDFPNRFDGRASE